MPRIKIDLNKPVLDLSESGAEKGLQPTNQKLSHVLGQMLKASTEGDALKYLDWAIELYQSGAIEVDQSDLELLTNFVKNNRQAWALVKGQLLREFIAAKSQ